MLYSMGRLSRGSVLSLAFLMGAILFPKWSLAAPAITSVSGTINEAQTVTITGSGFGVKSPAKPYFWAPMEGSANPSSLGIVTAWGGMNDMAYAAGCGPAGGGCLQGDAGNKIWTAKVNATGDFSWAAPGQKAYLYRKLKTTFSVFSPVAINWKSWRVWGTILETGATTSIMDGVWNGSFAMDHTVESGDSLWPIDGPCGFGTVGQWNTNEILLRSNTNAVGKGDGFFLYRTNGANCGEVPYESYNGTRYLKLWDASQTVKLQEFYAVHGVKANHTMAPTDRYSADDVYLDTTWSRVMIGNASTLASSTQIEIQIPTAWSSNSLTISSYPGQFNSGQTAYLYVIDSNNDVNANGYPITIGGGGGDTTPPTVSLTAPANGATVSGTTTTVSATASDNSGTVSGVQFRLDGANLGAEDTTSPFSTVWNTTTETNGAHTLTAVARDPSGNTATSSSVSVTVSNGDTTPPTSPSGLGANATSTSSITVTWTASTDNVGVTGYIVERCQGSGCSNFTQVGTPTASPFVDSGLTPNTFYNYHVRARDAANNLSGWSNVVGATTQAGTPAPAFTLTANPTTITSGQSSTLTWSAVTNATSCTATGGTFTGSKATSGGTQSVSPTSTTTFTLSCTGTGGTTNRTATVTVTNPNELIIDNTDATTAQSGSWTSSTAYPGYYGSDYFYSSTTNGEWFEWNTSSLTAGTYEVYARWPAATGRPTDVIYRITHSGTTDTVGPVNQEVNGSQWNLLGTYAFGTTGSVRVIGTATGWEGTAADAIRFLKISSGPTPCNTVTPTNFSQSTYNSYGAPFDPFTSNTPLVNVRCNSADTDTITLTTGVTGDTTRIIYTKGYWYDAVTTAWRQYAGTCTGALNGEWCQGSVSATITDPNVSTASAANPTYLVGMTCSVQGLSLIHI